MAQGQVISPCIQAAFPMSESRQVAVALGLMLGLCPAQPSGRGPSAVDGGGRFHRRLSQYKLSGNLDTRVSNRVHRSFIAREYINYKQICPLVLVEQHDDQRDTIEMYLLLQPLLSQHRAALRAGQGAVSLCSICHSTLPSCCFT